MCWDQTCHVFPYMSPMDPLLSVADILRGLSMAEIQSSLPEHTFSYREKHTWPNLDMAVCGLLNKHLTVLSDAVHSKRRWLLREHLWLATLVEPTVHQLDEDNFLETVSEEVRQKCISNFIDATSRVAMLTTCCAVCAGQFFSKDISKVKVNDLQAKNILSPTTPHPAHILTDGMLLHHTASSMHTLSTGVAYANVCTTCVKSLQNNKLPPLSLANGMWVGDVPLELCILTLPEHILVVQYFPAAYIVKLYLMKKGAHCWSSSSLQSGLWGNVSTYHLNMKDIINMTQSQVMPPSPEILAATIGIMFVGPKNLPEKSMPSLLHVNRAHVHNALHWLKQNNPIYENIEISSKWLNTLPVDGVPVEIWLLMKHSNDTTMLAEEHDNYVPEDSVDNSGQCTFSHLCSPQYTHHMVISAKTLTHILLISLWTLFSTKMKMGTRIHQICSWQKVRFVPPPCKFLLKCTVPESIPLHSLGVVDVAANDVPQNEVLAHALTNVAQDDKVEGWAVKHSSDFVNEYPCKTSDSILMEGSYKSLNHLLESFPYLFPYGMGGYEVQQAVKVTYKTHAWWSLRYEDKWFQKDLHFMFQMFSVIQKRQLCTSTCLQVSKCAFLWHTDKIRSLSNSDFNTAAEEEKAHKPFSNSVMRSLHHVISTVRSNVVGTNESWLKIWSLIWGMCIRKGPPSIWLTINPADTQDPIAQVLCGEDIDLDNFSAHDHHPLGAAIAADPYAAALFFHTIIYTVLEKLLGIQAYSHAHPVQHQKGILGNVEGYVGTTEAQGWGMQHLHMLLWLSGSLTTTEMHDHLHQEEFRSWICKFIATNIHADIGSTQGLDVLSIPRQPMPAFSCPVDPQQPNYEAKSEEFDEHATCIVQVHQCGQVCMKLWNSRMVCKHNAPFQLADEAWVNERGEWGPKQTYAYLNNWCPAILQCVCANHNIKLITNGKETKDIAFYITNYSTKILKKSSNISALLAKTFIHHRQDNQQTTELTWINKWLIQQCGNTLSHEQELSAPEVINYLMGLGQ